jgi:iron complex outermembrane recepter protein
MRKLLHLFVTTAIVLLLAQVVSAQTKVSGTVTDKESGDPLIGASVTIKGTTEGTTTDLDGNFELKTQTKPSFTLEISNIGLVTQEFLITKNNEVLKVKMEEIVVGFGSEVVVSASRVEEKIMESPVTVEKLDPIAIKQSSTADYYDEISKLKGVHTSTGSLTFTSINTRGFASIANTRFVQLMDGMDNAAPLLNFPTGNIVGISELDIANVELVPGASSALYGPNAFNGILLMNSKSPYDFQGLSAQVKIGLTSSEGDANNGSSALYRGVFPYQKNFNSTMPSYQAALRYAKSFGKFAFKANISVLDAQDWPANDYTTDRAYLNSNVNDQAGARQRMGMRTFDGMNTYGDEVLISYASTSIQNAVAPTLAALFGFPTVDSAKTWLGRQASTMGPSAFTLSGFREEDLLDTRRAQSFKGDLSLHYKINDKTEASYSFRMGGGASVYQGSERYALRDFTQQYHKLEVKGKNYFARAYTSITNAGKSFNMTALGTYMLTSSGQTIRYMDDNGAEQSYVTRSFTSNYLTPLTLNLIPKRISDPNYVYTERDYFEADY